MPPSPGRAVSDSEGEISTSGSTGCGSASGIGSGSTSMPSPSATCRASSCDALRSDATMRSRMAGTVTLLSSKRNAAAMWACSMGVWLS